MKQLVLVVAGLAALALSGCQKEGCLGGEANCKVPPPCPKVAFTCDADSLDWSFVRGAAGVIRVVRPAGGIDRRALARQIAAPAPGSLLSLCVRE